MLPSAELQSAQGHELSRHGGKINSGKVVGKTIGETLHKTDGTEQIIMSRGGMIPKFFERSTVSVDTSSGGASSNFLNHKKILALAAVRHEESSQMISAQRKKQTDVKFQASGDRLHS